MEVAYIETAMIPASLTRSAGALAVSCRVCALGAVLALGCGQASDDSIQLRWDPAAGELGAFPDDAYTVDDSTSRTGLRLAIEPGEIPELSELPQTYANIFRDMSSLDGFGLSAGMWIRFDGALDPDVLVTGEATAAPISQRSSPLSVVVVTDSGPTPWPVEVSLTDDDRTIVLEPMIPLPPATEVYVAVTDRIASADGRALRRSKAMAAALGDRSAGDAGDRVAPRMRDAAESFVAAGGVDSADELLGVIVFTTQSVFEDAIAIAADIAERPVSAQPVIDCVDEPLWIRCEGSFFAVDYRDDGDVIADILDAQVDSGKTYELPFTVWLPLSRPGPYGGDAFPTVIFGHGLGGGRTQAARLAEFAAPLGMATIAIDSVRHGDHPTAENTVTLLRVLDFFAIDTDDLSFEPLRMRDHFRQSTYDKLQLVELLAGGLDVDGDQVVDLDPARISYLGVSLGGIMGPEFLALAPDISAGVLVVPGGRVSSIVSDADQFSIIIDLMKPPGTPDGDVERFFPVLQTTLDRGDAAPWGTHLLDTADRPSSMPDTAPHILMAMVIDDDTVPNISNRALARAMGIPVVPPLRHDVGIVAMTEAAPVSANLPDGRTAGMLQFDRISEDGTIEPATHSNVGDSNVGAEAWFHFLDSHLTGGPPVIIDPYETLGID